MSRFTRRDPAHPGMLAVFDDYMAYCRGTQSILNSTLSLSMEQDRRLHLLINRMFPYVPVSTLPSASPLASARYRPSLFQTTSPMRPRPVDTGFVLGQSFSPVIVRPTEAHITAATQVYLFREMDAPINSTCPITQTQFLSDDLVMQIVHCGHNFCPDALRDWFERDVRCPLCRYDVRGPGAAVAPPNANASSLGGDEPEASPLQGTISGTTHIELASRIGRMVAADFMERVAPNIVPPEGGGPINMSYSFMSSLGGSPSEHAGGATPPSEEGDTPSPDNMPM